MSGASKRAVNERTVRTAIAAGALAHAVDAGATAGADLIGEAAARAERQLACLAVAGWLAKTSSIPAESFARACDPSIVGWARALLAASPRPSWLARAGAIGQAGPVPRAEG